MFDDEDDDEPLFWEVVEAKYGRRLNNDEMKRELVADYFADGIELSDEDLDEDLRLYGQWQQFDQDLKNRQHLAELEKERPRLAAEDLYAELCSVPFSQDDEFTDLAFEDWENRVNSIIQTRMDIDAIFIFCEIVARNTISRKASKQAMKMHREHHALKDEVFVWLDKNMSPDKSMDSVAEAIAGKIAPIKFRTARNWVGQWKKLKQTSESTDNSTPGDFSE